MNPKIIEEEPINIYELATELKRIKKTEEEVNIRTNKVLDYLQNFKFLTKKEAKELFNELMKLKIPRFKVQYAHKIIDVLPASLEEMKVVLHGYNLTISNDNMKKIVAVVKKYSKDE